MVKLIMIVVLILLLVGIILVLNKDEYQDNVSYNNIIETVDVIENVIESTNEISEVLEENVVNEVE